MSVHAGPGAAPPCLGGEITSFLDFLRLECGVSQNTLAAYSLDLAKFARFLFRSRVKLPRAIRPHHVTRFLSQERLVFPEENNEIVP